MSIKTPVAESLIGLVRADKGLCEAQARARLDLTSARFHLLFGGLLIGGILTHWGASACSGEKPAGSLGCKLSAVAPDGSFPAAKEETEAFVGVV